MSPAEDIIKESRHNLDLVENWFEEIWRLAQAEGRCEPITRLGASETLDLFFAAKVAFKRLYAWNHGVPSAGPPQKTVQ